jgi:hypothetical protein
MIMNFDVNNKYIWADVGSVTSDNQVDVPWNTEWDGKRELLCLVNGEVVLEPNLNYTTDRQLAYPPIGDQLDALFHAGVFPAEMAAEIQAVKDSNPKT